MKLDFLTKPMVDGAATNLSRLLLILGITLVTMHDALATPVRAAKITGLSFEGNTHFSSQRLLHELHRLRVNTSAPLTPMNADDAAFFIREFYVDQGFADAEADPRFDPLTKSAVILIEEGERASLGQMTFEEKGVLSESRLRDVVTASLRRSSRRLVGTLRYVPPALDQAATDLRQLYISKGYLGAEVRWESAPAPQPGRMDVTFHITEGPLFVLEGATVEGVQDAPLPPDFFESHLGRPFTPDEDMLLQEQLLRHFRERGYFAAKVAVEREVNPRSGKVFLRFRLEAGPPYHVGQVVITGVQKTNPAALRGLFGWKSGELYNATRRRKSLERLWATGAFSNIQLEQRPRQNGVPLLDMNLHVEEGQARGVRFSLGYNEWEMATGAVEYSDRNFFGSLTRFDLRLQGSQKGYGALATLTDPFLLNTELRGSISGYYIRQEWPGYRASFAGGVLGVRRVFREPGLSGYQFQFEYREVFDTTIFGLPQNFSEQFNYTVSALAWDQTLDKRNDTLAPMSGYFLNYKLLLATEALGGDLNFFQPSFQVSWYHPLREITPERPLVPFLMVNHRAGTIFPFAGTGDVPTPERFFLGGPNTVRSFQLDGMAPRDSDGDPIGGEFFWQLNLEAQVPLFGPFYAVGFVDFGNLSLTWEEVRVDDTRIAPGIGARIYTPIGAVFADYGYNLVRKDGDPVGALQFGFGFTF